jgi:hypothetical protein
MYWIAFAVVASNNKHRDYNDESLSSQYRKIVLVACSSAFEYTRAKWNIAGTEI